MPSNRNEIIQLTNGEAGIETREKVFLLDWMETYKENQAKQERKMETKSKLLSAS